MTTPNLRTHYEPWKQPFLVSDGCYVPLHPQPGFFETVVLDLNWNPFHPTEGISRPWSLRDMKRRIALRNPDVRSAVVILQDAVAAMEESEQNLIHALKNNDEQRRARIHRHSPDEEKPDIHLVNIDKKDFATYEKFKERFVVGEQSLPTADPEPVDTDPQSWGGIDWSQD